MNKTHVFLTLIAISLTALACEKKTEIQPLPDAETVEQNQIDSDVALSNEPNADIVQCEGQTLARADAEKWECVPGIGFWCTESAGCPVAGNTVSVGTRLYLAQPIPKEPGYRFQYRGIRDDLEMQDQNIAKVSFYAVQRWECMRDEGCSCGNENLKKGGICIGGDTIHAWASVDTACNKQNCSSFCRDQKCVCGDTILDENTSKSGSCNADLKICMKEDGCTYLGKQYAYHQIWHEFEWKVRQDEHDNDKQDAPDIKKCSNDEGCPCGKQLCVKGEFCSKDLCEIYWPEGDGQSEEHFFYCDKPQGCECGPRHQLCPNESVCYQNYGNRDWSSRSTAFCYHAGKLKETERHQTLHDFSLSRVSSKDIIFHENYYGGTDYDDMKKQLHIVCSDPGCDCNGEPLKENYKCIEQRVVYSYGDSDEYGACDYPYQRFTHDSHIYADGECQIGETILEQVCDNPKGCQCAGTIIRSGDTCVEGQARCSSLKPNPGCMCGSTKLKKGFGCLRDHPICLSDECACSKTKIHRGDQCTENNIICGEYSTTANCMCNDKLLRDGYLCYRGEQYCASESCKCGDVEIGYYDECGPDDKQKQVLCDEYYDDSCEENAIPISLGCLDSLPDLMYGTAILNYAHTLDRKYMCTCGTGMPTPGKDYGCALREGTKGNGSEWTSVGFLEGYQCLNYEGCPCGDSRCKPGDLCEKRADGALACREFGSPKTVCEGQNLASLFKLTNQTYLDYSCYDYDSSELKSAPGWYCTNPDGCACGNTRCEQWQMCLTPGYCSKFKYKLQHLSQPLIERIGEG